MRGPVHVGGTVVRTGDIVVGDADGVVVMPSARAAELAALGERLLRDEQDVLASIVDSTIDRSWVLRAMDEVKVVDPGQT